MPKDTTCNEGRWDALPFFMLYASSVQCSVVFNSVMPFLVGHELSGYGLYYTTIVGVSSILKSAVATLSGWLTDRCPPRRVLPISFFLSALAYLMVSVGSSSHESLRLYIFLGGVALASVPTSVTTVLSVYGGRRWKGARLASLEARTTSLWNAAFMGAPVILKAFQTTGISHRSMLYLLSICNVVCCVLASRLPPAQGLDSAKRDGPLVQATARTSPSSSSTRRTNWRRVTMTLRAIFPSSLILVWFIIECLTPVFDLTPVVAMLQPHEAIAAASTTEVMTGAVDIASLYALSSVVTIVISWTPWQQDFYQRVGIDNVAVYGAAVQGLTTAVLPSLVQWAGHDGLVIALVLQSIAQAVHGAASAAWLRQHYHSDSDGMSYGLCLAQRSLGMAVAQVTTGYVRRSLGVWSPFYGCALGLMMTSGAGWALRPNRDTEISSRHSKTE